MKRVGDEEGSDGKRKGKDELRGKMVTMVVQGKRS